MFKKSFFGFSEPHFCYESLGATKAKQVYVSNSKTIALHLKEPLPARSSKGIQVGDKIKTGQKIYLSDKSNIYAISSVTGTIESISSITSSCGSPNTAVTISVSGQDEIDGTFEKISNTPTLEVMADFLAACPGEPPIRRLLDEKNPAETILIYGGDTDILLHSSLRIMADNPDAFSEGVRLLKAATGIENVVIVVPEDTVQNYSGHLDAKVRTVSSQYPYAQPLMIAYEMTGTLPGSGGIDSTNMCFLRSEAVVTIGRAFKNGILPVKKTVSIIGKNGEKYEVHVRIGTRVSHVLESLNIAINDGDKIIFGGPMTGATIHSENYPVLPSTDLILIQDKKTIHNYSGYPCINCGDCVRICPANVPVNLLVRFLEAGRYEEGANLYDLLSCIECGLCSYVCVSRIPVFQYIKLAKYELDRTGYAEEMNE